MSDFYNLSIIILVCTKNTVYLCKQTTGQIDGAMIAFPGCKFAVSPLSGEFPGELGGRRGKRGGKSQAGFFLRASLRFFPPRDCKAGCIGDNPTFSDPLLVTRLEEAWALLFFLLMMIFALSMPASTLLFLTLGSAVWAPPSLLLTQCQMRSTSWACRGTPVLCVSQVEKASGCPLQDFLLGAYFCSVLGLRLTA